MSRISRRIGVVAAVLVTAAACSATKASDPSGPPVVEAGPEEDATPEVDAAVDAPADAFKPSGMCATTFGKGLTEGFGRIDGVVYAVQKPSDMGCMLPNSDHLILQVLMKSAVYRLVVNIESDRPGSDPKIQIALMPHALPAPVFAEGWHLGAGLDYVTTLGAHADASFTPLVLADAVTKIAGEVKVGDLVSVYGTSGPGRPESAHLIHRNAANQDGAIVVGPTTSPKFLLFHFDNQTF